MNITFAVHVDTEHSIVRSQGVGLPLMTWQSILPQPTKTSVHACMQVHWASEHLFAVECTPYGVLLLGMPSKLSEHNSVSLTCGALYQIGNVKLWLSTNRLK